MKKLTQEQKDVFKNTNFLTLCRQYVDLCGNNNLEVVKYLLTSSDLERNVEVSFDNGRALIVASMYGHLDIVKYLLTSPDLQEHVDIHCMNDETFVSACKNGHLPVIKYLLTSPELKEHANIHTGCEVALVWACRMRRLDIVQYLLTSPELKEHSNLHREGNEAFLWACKRNAVDIVEYLLTSPNLAKNVDVYYKSQGFIKLLKEMKERFIDKIPNFKQEAFALAYFNGAMKVIEYLIFDYKIIKNKEIKLLLEENKDDIEMKEVIKMFQKRDMNHKLQYELKESSEKEIKKPKNKL